MSGNTQSLSQFERNKNQRPIERLVKMPLNKAVTSRSTNSTHRPLPRHEAVREAIQRTG